MKYAAGIEYDGTDFYGWQARPGDRDIRSCVEAAFSKVADAPVKVVCAGRTDAGVHALGQVVHFETDARRDFRAWLRGTNANLPGDVALIWVKGVSEDFHARFSALRRCYRYLIFNSAERSAVYRRTSTWVYRPLDAPAMHRAAQTLVGEHDFSSFRAAGCQSRSPVRRMFSIDVQRAGVFLEVRVCANAFLQHMVRNIVGALIAVGAGDQPVGWIHELLAQRDRRQGGVAAGSSGLYLIGVEYDACFGIPRGQLTPTFPADSV